jgi:hypothetical protein
MTEELQTFTARLQDVADRLGRIEERLAVRDSTNGTTDPGARWQYLIARPHRWRRQLWIKGRNMTVGQLVSAIPANRLSPEQASANLDLPLAAIYEALLYHTENRGLIELEASEERRRLAERGLPLEPKVTALAPESPIKDSVLDHRKPTLQATLPRRGNAGISGEGQTVRSCWQ